MNYLINLFKELICLLVLIEVCSFMLHLVLRRTFIGKILFICKRTGVSYLQRRISLWKWGISKTHKCAKSIKNVIQNTIESLYEKIKNQESIDNENSERVVNEGNIIDLDTAKQLRYKWHK
ncbi:MULTISPECIES: hypothetical protein [unclassified Clostridium]|uniref:hypothetical protein n=1 Tax=unclassified Clostridium TaxID=2614128 RepID=UPI0025BB753A|nr:MULTISPECIES: hypothetical protein [unclassified Clostridium]